MESLLAIESPAEPSMTLTRTRTPQPMTKTPKVAGPRGRPPKNPAKLKTPLSSRPTTPANIKARTPHVSDTDDSDEEVTDIPGKNCFNFNQLPSFSSNNSFSNNKKYNNIMLIKNEQIISNTSSIKQAMKSKQLDRNNLIMNQSNIQNNLSNNILMTSNAGNNFNYINKSNGSAVEPPQQTSDNMVDRVLQQQHLGVSDRMSKEKQKFFRFSAFNKSKMQKQNHINNNNSMNNKNDDKSTKNASLSSDQAIIDKYKFVTSESEDEEDHGLDNKVCDNKLLLNKRKNNTKSVKISTKTLHNNNKSNLTVNNLNALNNLNNINLSNSKSTKLSVDRKGKGEGGGKRKGTKSKLRAGQESTSCSGSEEMEEAGDEEESSSDSDSSSSEGEGSSTTSSDESNSSSSSSSSEQNNDKKLKALNRAETLINNKNVFAYINSRELQKQSSKNRSYCWTSLPSQENQEKNEDKEKESPSPGNPFGKVIKCPEVWGFAAEAKKSVNIFNNPFRMESEDGDDDNSESDRNNKKIHRIKKKNSPRKKACSKNQNKCKTNFVDGSKNHDFWLTSRNLTLLNNNSIMSSDDDNKKLSPSRLFKKAVNYKKYDNQTLNNKKLIMNENSNLNKNPESDEDVDELPNEQQIGNRQQFQPPYNNNNQSESDMGKISKETKSQPEKVSIDCFTCWKFFFVDSYNLIRKNFQLVQLAQK